MILHRLTWQEIIWSIIGPNNMKSMVDVSCDSSADDPFCKQSLPAMEFDQVPITTGAYLDFRVELLEDVMMYVIDDNWSIVPYSLSRWTSTSFRKHLSQIGFNHEPIHGSKAHNIMFANMSRENIKAKFIPWWEANVCHVGKIIENVVDQHPWTHVSDYVRWRDSRTVISGFGGDGAQLYDKRGLGAAKLHDELGWSCAANVLVADRTRDPHGGASIWVGVTRLQLLEAGYVNNDIIKFHKRLDFRNMISEWLTKGVKVCYCVQRVGDLVISPPGNGSMHIVLSVGDLLQVSINHGFTLSGYNRCMDAWSNISAKVFYNSGLATRNIIGRQYMQTAFPHLLFSK